MRFISMSRSGKPTETGSTSGRRERRMRVLWGDLKMFSGWGQYGKMCYVMKLLRFKNSVGGDDAGAAVTRQLRGRYTRKLV